MDGQPHAGPTDDDALLDAERQRLADDVAEAKRRAKKAERKHAHARAELTLCEEAVAEAQRELAIRSRAIDEATRLERIAEHRDWFPDLDDETKRNARLELPAARARAAAAEPGLAAAQQRADEADADLREARRNVAQRERRRRERYSELYELRDQLGDVEETITAHQ
jgi:chromosome segregation ATPase